MDYCPSGEPLISAENMSRNILLNATRVDAVFGPNYKYLAFLSATRDIYMSSVQRMKIRKKEDPMNQLNYMLPPRSVSLSLFWLASPSNSSKDNHIRAAEHPHRVICDTIDCRKPVDRLNFFLHKAHDNN